MYLLFDCDGTLVDSMNMWVNLAKESLKPFGIDLPRENERVTASMSHWDACQYYSKHFLNGEHGEDLYNTFNRILFENYSSIIPLKAHVRETLLKLKADGHHLAVGTSTDENLIHLLLKRLDIFNLFDFIQTVDNSGYSKDSVAYYENAAKQFGQPIQDIIFFDDALYALKRSKEAGMKTIGVYEALNEDHLPEIKAVSDHFIHDFSEVNTPLLERL